MINSDEERLGSGSGDIDQGPKQIQLIENYIDNFMANYNDDQKTMMSNTSNKDNHVRKILMETLSNFKKPQINSSAINSAQPPIEKGAQKP